MNQIANIFKKDVRHHWVEIVLCQAALVAYVWNEMHGWEPHEIAFGIARYWPGAIYVLLPIAWWVLIIRVVQSESLVGDRQFWTTRPYEWKKLLAAKVLFVLIFINIPLLFAQMFLLMKASFVSAAYLPGIIWMQLLLVALPFLPLVALAAVTRNIAQGALAVLSAVLFTIGMAALSSVTESAMASADASDWIQALVLVIVCVMAIWLQFKRRKTGRARMFLALGAAAIFIIIAATPYLVKGESEYPLPAAGSHAPFRAILSPVKPDPPKIPPDKNEEVEIAIPMVTSGIADGSLAQVKAVRLSLEGQDGFRWESKWQSNYSLLLPGASTWIESFKMDHKIFDRMKFVPLKARVSVAINIFRDQDAMQVTAGRGEFDVPRVGRCWVDEKNSSSVECHAPLVKPETLLVRAESATSTCPASDEEQSDADEEDSAAKAKNSTTYAWEWNGDQGPAEYGVSPVESFTLYLSGRNGERRESAQICPGTPLTFSFPKFAQGSRAEFEVSELKLEDYRREPFRFTFGGFTINKKARKLSPN
jgi:hypothetical protein